MFNPDLILDLVLGSDLFILAGVLTLVVRSLKGDRGEELEAILEVGEGRIASTAEIVEGLYFQAKSAYEQFQDKKSQYKKGAADGISLDDAEVVASDLKSLVESIENLVPGRLKT